MSFSHGVPVPDWERRPADGAAPAPVITIGIPCYNRPALLAEALASLAAQRGSGEFEVVVCDDGALPETREVVEHSAIAAIRYYVNRPALGPVRNWNRCIEVATAPWVTILHEDDLLYPWFLASVLPRLRSGISAVAVRCVQGSQPPVLSAPSSHPRVRTYAPVWFLKASMTPFPGVVFPRDLGRRLGGFDPREAGLADYAFWYELARHGRIETVRSPAAFYRVNEGQWTERAWPTMLRRAHLLRLRIAREQLGRGSRLGRWLARFYTARMARAYDRRFSEKPLILTRARRFERIPFSGIPSGWVWAFLKLLGRSPP
ncbi:MAG TPA: glycosyltransferase [Opitutaceae bacterium]|nr:glycosyltransferase [Opitutaceae bacterium]